jgi:hypothetical protein
MASQITETPILSGNDARVFIERMKENEETRVSRSDMSRMRKNYASMKEIENNQINER